MGSLEGAAVGAGDVLTTMGRNARGLWADVTGNEKAAGEIAAEAASAQGLRERLRGEAPIASQVGALLPSLATLPIGMGIGGAGIAAGIGGQVATQAGLGALMGGLQDEGGDTGAGAGMGAALGGGGALGGQIVGRIAAARAAAKASRGAQTPGMSGALTTDELGVLAGADRAGMQVTPGQRVGSLQARKLEAGLSSNPMTSPIFDAIDQANKTQINRLAAQAMGVEGADSVGAAVRAQAESQIGSAFKQVGQAIGDVDTKALHSGLKNAAEAEATRGLPTSDAWKVLKQFEKGMAARAEAVAGAGADVIPGAELVTMRSAVSKDIRAAYANGKPRQAKALGDALEVIDESIAAAARAQGRLDVVENYGKAREQWTVLKALDMGGATTDGNVLPGQAFNLIKRADKTGLWGIADEAGQTTQRMGTGRIGEEPLGDLYDALRFTVSQVGKPVVGNSGTATRSAVGQIMQGGGLPQAVGMAARGLAVSPVMRAYRNMSPEAAIAGAAAVAAAKGAPGAAYTGAGGAIGRVGGVMGQ
jgi:hypothetical protein